MTIGEHMKAAREVRGVSRFELSIKSGIHPQMIGQIERGKQTPKITTVELLADALGISIDEYVGHIPRKG